MRLFILIVSGMLLIDLMISASSVLFANYRMNKEIKKLENVSRIIEQSNKEIVRDKRFRQSQREKKTASVSVIHWENDSVHGTPEQAETKRKIIDDLIKKMN